MLEQQYIFVRLPWRRNIKNELKCTKRELVDNSAKFCSEKFFRIKHDPLSETNEEFRARTTEMKSVC